MSNTSDSSATSRRLGNRINSKSMRCRIWAQASRRPQAATPPIEVSPPPALSATKVDPAEGVPCSWAMPIRSARYHSSSGRKIRSREPSPEPPMSGSVALSYKYIQFGSCSGPSLSGKNTLSDPVASSGSRMSSSVTRSCLFAAGARRSGRRPPACRTKALKRAAARPWRRTFALCSSKKALNVAKRTHRSTCSDTSSRGPWTMSSIASNTSSADSKERPADRGRKWTHEQTACTCCCTRRRTVSTAERKADARQRCHRVSSSLKKTHTSSESSSRSRTTSRSRR
mmetsp:Transcript_139283/g.444524  ORF Transcript_139283/g.444524 Transcript_139283/m.444524 type:complete len:285 (+) Transcript_139283:739-1593(+)